MTFWWFKEKRIRKKLPLTAPSYHKISTLRGITSGDGSLGLELSRPCYTAVKSGVVKMEWSQETVGIRKHNNMGSEASSAFNKTRKHEELATKMNRPVDKCKKENGMFIVNSNSVGDILVKFLYRPLTG